MKDRLTPKQARFVEEYIIDLNAAAAARRAGYSQNRSDQIGFALLRKVEIQDAISASQKAISNRTGVTQERVIRELARIAFADPRDVLSWGAKGVTPRESSELSDDQAAAVAEVSETRTKDGGSMRVKMHSKTDALEKLCRHLGLYDEKPKTDDGQTVVVYIPSNGRD